VRAAVVRGAGLVTLCIAAALALASPVRASRVPPRLNVSAAALIEASTGQEIYGRNADSRVPIASTTKLMTALLTLEHVHRLDTQFAQNDYYPAAADSQIGLVPGERMSVHDLLLAMLLPSADDAAEDLAYNVGRHSIPYFVAMMNVRARELGLTDTHYSTPIGLDTPGNYSSASDLVKLARFMLRTQPFFSRAVALPSAVLRTGDHVRVVTNLNDLVARFRWINGVKTGHTLDAGYVLVGSGTQVRMTLISAVMGTSSEAARDGNTLALLGYGFANYMLRTPVERGAVIARIPVRGHPGTRAPAIAAQTFTGVFPRSTRVRVRVLVPRQLSGPLPRRSVVGTALVLAGRRSVVRIPLLTAQRVPAAPHATLLQSMITRPFTLVALIVLVVATTGFAMFRFERKRGRRRPAVRRPV
jgi:serine-type D-Ala-D-Ala carboxypeptidase (penicillin-binding protein 5/6)